MSSERSLPDSTAGDDEQPTAPAAVPDTSHTEPTESSSDVYYAETFVPVGGNFRSDR